MPQSNSIIDKLLDDGVELSDLKLNEMPAEDLAHALIELRAYIFTLISLVDMLSEQVKLVDAFARPHTRRFFYVPSVTKRVQ